MLFTAISSSLIQECTQYSVIFQTFAPSHIKAFALLDCVVSSLNLTVVYPQSKHHIMRFIPKANVLFTLNLVMLFTG